MTNWVVSDLYKTVNSEVTTPSGDVVQLLKRLLLNNDRGNKSVFLLNIRLVLVM